ncbi:MAG: AAA family ATPase [Candidatus Poribacteria bacterium]|nr:AAA family ATPase [Candidatus Poribacteria bacterium]
MLLERIRLKTFGCFQEQDFDLHDGINLIFGPNFSGKSTLVNAIFFTLTGKPIVPRVDASAIKNAKAYSGTAGLQFIANSERYQLYRATGRRTLLRSEKNGAWHVLFDDKRIRPTEAMLQERFGIMHEQLALTTFLREGEIFEFLARQSATRRDILHTLLGIDRLIEVRQRFIDTRRIAKREQGRIRAHQNSLRFNAQNVNEAEIAKIEAKLKDLETAYGAETGDSALIAEWVQHQIRLQKQLTTLKHQQDEALSGFNDIAHLREMMTAIETAIQEAAGLEAKRDELMQQTGRLESEIAALANVCNTLRTLIESDEQHCPTCYQQVEREVVQRIIDEKAEEKSQRTAELETHKQSLETETENLKSRRELEQRLQTLQALSTQFQQRAEGIDKIQTELDALTLRLNERGVQQSEQIPSDTLATVDKSQLKSQIDNERERLGKLKQEEAVRLDRLGALQRVNRDAAKVEKTLLSLELACTGIDKTIEALQRQILKPAEDELHHWLDKMQLFSGSRGSGGQTRVDLQREHLLPSLNIDGTDRSLMLLSGSEKMFLYLCFKVALAKVLGNPGFFVFDDPTLHLDGERKALMVDFICQLAEEHQVVVASYDEDVRLGLEGAHLIEMRRES